MNPPPAVVEVSGLRIAFGERASAVEAQRLPAAWRRIESHLQLQQVKSRMWVAVAAAERVVEEEGTATVPLHHCISTLIQYLSDVRESSSPAVPEVRILSGSGADLRR